MKPRILVIRGGAIGDFILTLPAIRLLRDNFPEAHIEILGYRHIIAVADGRFYADATRSIEYAGLSRFFMPRVERDSELVSYFASFQQVVSYLYDPDGFFEGSIRESGVKNFLAGPGRLDDSAHAVEQLAQPLEKLALFLDGEVPEIFPSADDHAAAVSFLGESARPRVAIHIGSGSPGKNWPIERWIGLMDWLLSTHDDLEVLLLSGEADEDRVRQLTGVSTPGRVLVAHGRPLTEVAALVKNCFLYLGHDSGISHLAAAVGTPTIVLFGPTDPAVWGPRNSNVSILQAADGDLALLPVETVIEQIERSALL